MTNTALEYEISPEKHAQNTAQWDNKSRDNSNNKSRGSHGGGRESYRNRYSYSESDRETADYFSDDDESGTHQKRCCCFASTITTSDGNDEDQSVDNRRRKRKLATWTVALYLTVASIIFLFVLLWLMKYIFVKVDPSLNKLQESESVWGHDEQGRMLCNGYHLNCFRRANEIMYATVHNAMSSRADGFLAFNNLFPLEDALQAGFRGLTIDSCDCGRVGIQLCHSLCVAGFRRPNAVFENIVTFLRENPYEIIIIEIQVNGDSLWPLFEMLKEVEGLSSLIYEHPSVEQPWPKLMDMIEMDQRLIILAHDDIACEEGSCPAGVHSTYEFAFETPFEQKGLEDLMRVELSCSVSRGWSNSEFIISNHFATDERGLPSIDVAMDVNKKENLQARLEYCQEKFSTKYKNEVINLLVVDFWNIGDTLVVVDDYNRQLEPKTEAPTDVPSASPTEPRPSAAPSINNDLDVANFLLTTVPSFAPTLEPSLATVAPTQTATEEDLSSFSPTQSITQAMTTTATFPASTSMPTFSIGNENESATLEVPTSVSSTLEGLATATTTTSTASPTAGETYAMEEEEEEEVVAVVESALQDPEETKDNSTEPGHSISVPEKDLPGS